MAKIETKIDVDVSAVAQRALNDFVRKIEKEHGIAIQSISFDWVAQMDGRFHCVGSDINTRKVG